MTNEQMRLRKSQPLNPPEKNKKDKKEHKEKQDQKGEKTKEKKKEKTHSPKGEKAKERKEKAKKRPESEKAEMSKKDDKKGEDGQKASSGDGGGFEIVGLVLSSFDSHRLGFTWINHESVLVARYIWDCMALGPRIISRAQAKQQKIDHEWTVVTK